jgi:hypothetical protein
MKWFFFSFNYLLKACFVSLFKIPSEVSFNISLVLIQFHIEVTLFKNHLILIRYIYFSLSSLTSLLGKLLGGLPSTLLLNHSAFHTQRCCSFRFRFDFFSILLKYNGAVSI